MISVSMSKQYVKPVEQKDKQRGFIKWGLKNDYPFFLIELLQGSAWHQGILKNKTFYIAGNGLEVTSGDATRFLANSFSDFDMNEIVQRLTFDFELFGGMAVKGTWNREGTAVAKWEYLPIDMCRLSEDERTMYLSDNWSAMRQTPEDTNFRTLTALDDENPEGSFFLYYKEPAKQAKDELGIYPKPPYVGGITAIQTDVDISKFHMYEIQNGFKAGTLINLASGEPETAEEERRIKEQIKGRTQSVEDAGEIIITFSNGSQDAPSVLSLTGNDLDERYQMTEKSVQQNILVAHSVVAPSLFGIAPQGSFNAAESADLFEIFKLTYVNARQKQIEWMINYMAKLSGAVATLKLVDVSPLSSADAPAAEVTAPVGDIPANETQVDVAKSALNGAQIASLVEVVANIKSGILTPDSGLQIIMASFPTIDEAQARKIVGLPQVSMSKCRHTDKFSEDELQIFSEYGDDADDYLSLASYSIPWDSDTEDVYNKHFLLFDTIGKITVSPGEDNGLGKFPGGTAQYDVRYKYQEIPGIPPVKTESREFCRRLIDLNRLYSREEIDLISERIDRDVWRYRGGWYTNPDTGKTTPYCRHEWSQLVVVLKPKGDSVEIEVKPPAIQGDKIQISDIKQGKEISKSIFNENSDIKINKVSVSSQMNTEKMTKYLDQLKNLTAEYKIGNALNTDIELSFQSTSRVYGVVNFRGFDAKITKINLGHTTEPAQYRNADNRAFINERGRIILQGKSAVDAENAEISTITHEMAHVFSITESINPQSREYFSKLAEIRKTYMQEINQAYMNNDVNKLQKIYLGKYANTDLDEFHAEAFTEYKLMKNPSAYAKKVGKLFDSYFKK
jgi:hypothetical protein